MKAAAKKSGTSAKKPAKKSGASAKKASAAKQSAPASKTARSSKSTKSKSAKSAGSVSAGSNGAGPPVVDAQGKKVLPDISDEQFEKDLVADPSIKEDEKEAEKQGFVVSSSDESDESEQQVMVAGATADPVKDYLKQIG
ncbi:MAG: RNA polymerase sigma factor, partial [Nocardioidaceae bacterium]